jgi:hypothetical protein
LFNASASKLAIAAVMSLMSPDEVVCEAVWPSWTGFEFGSDIGKEVSIEVEYENGDESTDFKA